MENSETLPSRSKLFNLSPQVFTAMGKLSLDHIFVLEMLINGEVDMTSAKIGGIYQGLERKGYILQDLSITQQGIDFYTKLLAGEIVVPKKLALTKNNLIGLHKKLQDKLFELQREKQVKTSLSGKQYNFLCNDTDLMNRVAKVIAKYKITDFSLVERTLLSYIEKCHRTNRWFPLVSYYIIKRGDDGIDRSEMVTDMQNGEEKQRKTINSDL